MGSFGDSVVSLLDTYTRCLALLKELTRGSKASQEQVRLGTSIRSSRSKVRRHYSSQVSESGSSFEKGDATARSALRRLVRRVRAFTGSLMRTFGMDGGSGIDYESLMTLSNRSGLEAIRTMTDLSERVSVKSTSSRSSVQRRARQQPSSKRSSRSERNSRSSSAGSASSQRSKRVKITKTKAAESNPSTGSTPGAKTQPNSSKGQKATHAASRRNRLQSTERLDRRHSTLTTSSDSTKLGEIKHDGSGRPPQATYPLRGYRREPVTSKRGKWLGLFGS